jgi:hypothetical protein
MCRALCLGLQQRISMELHPCKLTLPENESSIHHRIGQQGVSEEIMLRAAVARPDHIGAVPLRQGLGI